MTQKLKLPDVSCGVVLTKAPNGGWMVCSRPANSFDGSVVMGCFTSTRDMVTALADALEVTPEIDYRRIYRDRLVNAGISLDEAETLSRR